MIKRVVLVIFPLFAIIALLYYLNEENKNPTDVINSEKKPLSFKDNSVQCPECNMFLVGKDYTVQVITNDNKTHFFDDPGCAILWLNENNIDDKDIVIWFYTVDTKRWKKSDEVYFSISDMTPMRYGFGAYENKKDGLISYNEMKMRMLRGENMTNPKIRRKILENLRGKIDE